MNEKILIIDREQDILTTMDAILTSEGYRIRSTQSYEKAIGIIQSEPFDLVIMDIGIRGGMGGHEAIRQIKKLDGNMEVIVLTGSVSIENAVKALRRKGAFDFLAKPLEDVEQLISTVKAALKKHGISPD